MNRDIPEAVLIDYLYGELDADAREEVERMLAESPAARARLERLRETRGMMQVLADEPAPSPPVFVEEPNAPKARWVPTVITGRRAWVTALAAAAVLIVMFTNVEFGVRDGGLHFSAAWRGTETSPRPDEAVPDSEKLLTVEDYIAVQQRYFELTRQLIEASELKQDAKLARVVDDLETKRSQDVYRLTQAMADVGVVAEQGYRQSGMLIRQLGRQTGM